MAAVRGETEQILLPYMYTLKKRSSGGVIGVNGVKLIVDQY